MFVTHDQEEAFVLGDEVAVMHDGRIVQVDTPQTLYAAPATRWVAEFVGEASLLPARAEGTIAVSAIGDLPLGESRRGPVDVVVRPEELDLVDGDLATVELVEFFGHDAMVHVAVADQSLRVRTGPNPATRRGDRVGLRFAGRSVQAFPTG